jgi:hypothetical protein
MRKFNQGEKNVIIEGLELYLQAWIEQIEGSIKRGKRPLFTEGYARHVINDILNHVDELTKVTK